MYRATKKYIRAALTVVLYFNQVMLFAQDSLNVTSLFHWQNDTIPTSAIENTYNEIWGYAKGGREYAIIGTTLGTHIFDVTDVANSIEVAYIPGKHQGEDIVHRDFHDYKGYLYAVADEGQSSLQIIDLHFLPDSAPVVYDSDTLIRTSHNIFIDTISGRLYTCGGAVKRKGFSGAMTNLFSVISLENPLEPNLVINCSIGLPYWDGIGRAHDAYVKNDTVYCNAGQNGLFVLDFSDTSNVHLIGSLTQYVQKGYNHSGWLSDDGKTYALADENWGLDIKILDVADLNDIEVADTVNSNVHELSIAHNLILKGNYLYVSYYNDGLYIFDVTNKDDVRVTGYYDTSTRPHDSGKYEGAWGVYPFLPSGKILLSDMQTGLWVFDATKATSIEEEQLKDKTSYNVFPNPFNEYLNVKTTNKNTHQYYTISDVTGKSLYSGWLQPDATNKVVLEPELPAGVYFMTISSSGKDQFTQKVIKE